MSKAFIFDITQNFNEIWEGKFGTLMLVKTNGGALVSFVELKKAQGNEFYTVRTAFPARPDRLSLEKRKLLWRRGTPTASTGSGSAGPPSQSPGSSSRTTGSNSGPSQSDSNVIRGQSNSNANIEPKSENVKGDTAPSDDSASLDDTPPSRGPKRLEPFPGETRLKYSAPTEAQKADLQPKLRGIFNRIGKVIRLGNARPDVIRKFIERELDLPINEGGIRKKGARGLFFIKRRTIRLRNRNNIDTLLYQLLYC
ncbi:hypothetical protein UZ36_06795 [Candidatus Nitromaritima sp. SCGC AAA799-C22]|nr:hypothetical protein UZ36_06795 [Candidatus Nitromaritima sp. SCGC AAA799-C22]